MEAQTGYCVFQLYVAGWAGHRAGRRRPGRAAGKTDDAPALTPPRRLGEDPIAGHGRQAPLVVLRNVTDRVDRSRRVPSRRPPSGHPISAALQRPRRPVRRPAMGQTGWTASGAQTVEAVRTDDAGAVNGTAATHGFSDAVCVTSSVHDRPARGLCVRPWFRCGSLPACVRLRATAAPP
jgi:hypothetical protein